MTTLIHRRGFLTASAAMGVSLAMAGRLSASPVKTKLLKALQGDPDEKTLREWKAAGFDGVESRKWQISPSDAAAVRKKTESLGMRIHSVQFGCGDFTEGAAARAATLSNMETALRAAKSYGAEDVLFIPGRIGVEPMPEAWEFDIRFDKKTGHLTQVVAGDNAKYRKYIEAHDRAVDASREGVKRLIPTAEKTGVVIALENIWNNLWVEPHFFADFVASFDSPWIKANFDIGNHVKYSRPQDWVPVLGKLVLKCHVKDFKLNPDGHGGQFCNIRDGSVDWPAVRTALDQIGFSGWMTIEGGDLSPQEHAKRLDLILAGK
jgi:L-ribulose-5-phosphate 3-epimerase